jgi:hypothetical protein
LPGGGLVFQQELVFLKLRIYFEVDFFIKDERAYEIFKKINGLCISDHKKMLIFDKLFT